MSSSLSIPSSRQQRPLQQQHRLQELWHQQHHLQWKLHHWQYQQSPTPNTNKDICKSYIHKIMTLFCPIQPFIFTIKLLDLESQTGSDERERGLNSTKWIDRATSLLKSLDFFTYAQPLTGVTWVTKHGKNEEKEKRRHRNFRKKKAQKFQSSRERNEKNNKSNFHLHILQLGCPSLLTINTFIHGIHCPIKIK